MAIYEREGARIYYEEHGEGFPVLLIAPGGMKSAIALWANAPWNPIEQLQGHFRVVAMDQRNAGRSSGPIHGSHGWQTYTDDQLGLMDHLGIDRFHVLGMCIGGPYCLGLVRSAPQRVVSAVLFQPIGREDNRDAFHAMFDAWAEEQDARAEDLAGLRENMFGGDRVLFNVDEAFLRQCPAPLCILMGDDLYHPQSASRLVADLVPDALLVERWKEEPARAAARAAVDHFLERQTPSRVRPPLPRRKGRGAPSGSRR